MEQDSVVRVAAQASNRAMVEQIRVEDSAPYLDRRPVRRVIDVPGRRTGVPRPFPINVTAVDGKLYLCSATRSRDWLRNLLAAGRCRVERDGPSGGDTVRHPVLVEGREAATVLVTYLPHAGYRDPALPFELDAPIDEIERHAHRTAVVRLDLIA